MVSNTSARRLTVSERRVNNSNNDRCDASHAPLIGSQLGPHKPPHSAFLAINILGVWGQSPHLSKIECGAAAPSQRPEAQR